MKRMFMVLFVSAFFVLTGCKMSTPISPGELVDSHKHLEGTSNCTKCHTPGKKVTDEKCLSCHSLISQRIANNIGYHSSREVKQKSCVKCHSDHHGRKFEIIHFDSLKFDHKLTGYVLQGAHNSLDCSKCHISSNLKDSVLMNRSVTYLGLEKECASCHSDQHRGTLGKECGECHGQDKFFPASGFDHGNADYKLAGSHIEVNCDKCHPVIQEGESKYQQFKGLKFEKCNSCHKDVHENKFGSDCASCHSENSFHEIRNPDDFDHDLTGYKLIGKHSEVLCESCHGANFKSDIAHSTCLNCHKDYHRGIFRTNGRISDCNQCHTVLGFSETTYTVQKHRISEFPLTGAHEKISCLKCHDSNGKWKFRDIGRSCIDCHKDIHAEFISASLYNKNCEVCHKTSEWKEVHYNHKLTGYILEGAHQNQSCRACHFKGSELSAQRFKSLDQRCIQCHSDIHVGQFESLGTTDCLKCHGHSNWQATRFNHDNTRFPLDGRHKNVACIKCHKEKVSGNLTYIQYKLNSFKCEDCH